MQFDFRQCLYNLFREWALHGDQRIPTAGVDRNRITNPGDVLTDPREILRNISSIDDQHVVSVGKRVD